VGFEAGSDIVRIPQLFGGLPIADPGAMAARVLALGGNAWVDLGDAGSLTFIGITADMVKASPAAFFSFYEM
jgi:hypothetical protein